MKKLLPLLFASLLPLGLTAQPIVWHNPLTQKEKVVQNQSIGSGLNYHRLPEDAKAKVRGDVWNLGLNSAGVTIRFKSNAPQIRVRYTVASGHAMPHMPATGVSGVDLYATTAASEELWCRGQYHFADTISYNYNKIVYRPDSPEGYSYELYLPLYNTVNWMEIGVPEGYKFRFETIDNNPTLPIVAYGTSITQGACASRPGMAWTAILKRLMKRDLVNIGFSGNGQLEPEVLELITRIPASLYILDCMPNMSLDRFPLDTIYARILGAVYQIRAAHPNTPILLTDHAGYPNGEINPSDKNSYASVNQLQAQAMKQLKAEGIDNIYHLTYKEIGMPMDGMVDGVHPTDYGMYIQAKAYEKKIKEEIYETK